MAMGRGTTWALRMSSGSSSASERDHVYLVPDRRRCQSCGPRLRLEPTRNNQKLGIRFAADYEIDRWSIESLRGLVSQEGSGADQLAFA